MIGCIFHNVSKKFPYVYSGDTDYLRKISGVDFFYSVGLKIKVVD